MSFQNLGQLKMSREEQNKEEAYFNSITKPFTTKSPSHVIESLDALSTFMDLPRNSLMNCLISNYLIHAFADFSEGYHNSDAEKETESKRLLTDLSKVMELSPDMSDEAKYYLNSAINDFILEIY